MPSVKLTSATAALVFAAAAFADHPVPGATGNVHVKNLCKKPIFLKSVGDVAGREKIIRPGQTWSEPYKEKDMGGGPSIKIRQAGKKILQLEYNPDGRRIWYNLSYVNCWNQQTKSGTSCPFWHDSFVLESPSHTISCKNGAECPFPYRCPHDDNFAMAITDGNPIWTLEDPTLDLTLHLCPCEHDIDSEACQLAMNSQLPLRGGFADRMQSLESCPSQPVDQIPFNPHQGPYKPRPQPPTYRPQPPSYSLNPTKPAPWAQPVPTTLQHYYVPSDVLPPASTRPHDSYHGEYPWTKYLPPHV